MVEQQKDESQEQENVEYIPSSEKDILEWVSMVLNDAASALMAAEHLEGFSSPEKAQIKEKSSDLILRSLTFYDEYFKVIGA